LALGVTSAKCTCEFDSRDKCICTVSGRATVDKAGDYVIVRVWVAGYEQYSDLIDSKTIGGGESATFNYSGSFDNTTPESSSYDIRLYKSGETNVIGTEKEIKPEECEEPEEHCPDPTVLILSVSNYTPISGESVDFTSYASGGTGSTITSRLWDFGDGITSSEENPSKAWTNTTGEDVDYTVTFTATNDCGTSNSTSTVITVSSAPVKTGIEIQFSEEMNGKQLIAHGAISTVCDLWWTGPHVVDGILWNKGRCTWDDIDSSKKYNILVGDPCQERAAIDGVWPEHPTECAGTFENNDYVVILIRNPGFDFRVYNSNNVVPITDSSFDVLYIDSTSGDIVDTAFTELICGLIGIETGSPCDMFWAEFYDPIFVANYMSIMHNGKDLVGNDRELGWLDHVAFVASLVGSLPVFNLFPFAGITKNLGNGIIVIARKVKDLAGDELAQAGGAMADICVNAPKAICALIQSELDEVRAALVKVYGDIQGNKYVDDALAAGRTLFDEAYDLIKNVDATFDDELAFNKLLKNNPGLGEELAEVHRAAVIRGPTEEELAAVLNHAKSAHTDDVIQIFTDSSEAGKATLASNCRLFERMHEDYDMLVKAKGKVATQSWTRGWGDTEIDWLKALKDPINAPNANIPDALNDFVHAGHILADELPDEVIKVPDSFSSSTASTWQATAKASAKAFSKKCWEKWNGLPIVSRLSTVEQMMVLSLAFATAVLGGIYRYAAGSTDEPTVYAITHAQFTHAMAQFYWKCDDAKDLENWETLAAAIDEYERCINDAEADLEYREDVLTDAGTYQDFYNSLKQHQFSLANFIAALNDATNSGTVVVKSNVKGFYAQLDEEGDLVTDYQSGQVVFHGVPAGEHWAWIQKGGYTSCTTPAKAVTPGDITTVSCDLVAVGGGICPEVEQVKISVSPSMITLGEKVTFIATATSEVPIAYVVFDFGNTVKITPPNGGMTTDYTYPKAGTWQASATVFNECGSSGITYSLAKVIVTEADGEIPGELPGTEEVGTLLVKKPVNAQNNIECNFGYKAEIFVDGKKVSDEAPFTIPFGTNKFIGGYGGPCGVPHTIMVRLVDYQDASQSWTINDGDDKSWTPEMFLDSYVPPVGTHPIDFYIPVGASLERPSKITGLSRLTTGIRRIQDNG